MHLLEVGFCCLGQHGQGQVGLHDVTAARDVECIHQLLCTKATGSSEHAVGSIFNQQIGRSVAAWKIYTHYKNWFFLKLARMAVIFSCLLTKSLSSFKVFL